MSQTDTDGRVDLRAWVPQAEFQAAQEEIKRLLGMIAILNQKVGLSDQQKAVMEGLRKGKTNNEIATAMGIHFKTVSTHCARLKRKFGLKYTWQLRLITPEAEDAQRSKT